MRKIYSIMFAAVAIFTAASCQKEITGAPEVKGEPFTLKAIRDTETKTVMTGDKSVSWTVGDKLIVFNAEAKGVEFVNTAETTQSTFKDTFFYWVVTNDYTTTHNLTYGYTTFEANGKDYIAYVKVEAANGNKARLVEIQDGDGTLEGFKAALTNNVIVFEAPLHHTSSFETGSLCYTGNSIGNCYVVTKNGVTYIGAHAQGLGLSLFQIK